MHPNVRLAKNFISRPGARKEQDEEKPPAEKGYIESFNGKLRDELLNREIFTMLTEAKILIEGWRREYNQIRPHSLLRYRLPAPEMKQPLILPMTLRCGTVIGSRSYRRSGYMNNVLLQ